LARAVGGAASRPSRVLLAVAVAVLAGAAWWFFARYLPGMRQREIERWRERLSVMALDRKAAIDLWLADGLADAATIASYPTLRYMLSDGPADDDGSTPFPAEQGARGHLAEIVRETATVHGHRCAIVADRSLQVVLRVGEECAMAGETAAARGATLTAGAHAEVVRDPAGRIGVVFAAPVAGPRPGEPPLGAVLLEHDPERFLYPLVRREPIPTETGETMLARVEGDELVFLHAMRRGGFGPLALRLPLATPGLAMSRGVAAGESFGELLDYAGVPVLAATGRLERAPWGLVVKVDTEEALAAYRTRRLMHLAVALAVIVAASGLAFGLLRAQRAAHQVALHAARARTAALLDHANDAILLLRADGRIEEANKRAEEFYGRTRHEIVGRSIADLRSEDERPRALEDLESVRRRGGLIVDTVHLAAGGRPVPVEVSSRLVDIAGEEVVVSLVRDVGERKAQEERIRSLNAELEERVRARTHELEEAYRELEAFSYSVSHDLRAPLRAIDGFARILQEDHAGRLDAEGLRVLGVVRDNARRMGELIDDLLALSRAARHEPRRQRVDMGELARTAFEELALDGGLDGVELRVSRLEPAFGDAGLLRQVWTNLISNALKFTRPRPRRVIDVGCRPCGEGVEYFVRDNGVGFDPRYGEKLFGVFQRLHPAEEFEGTGVGLALVRRIVARHGGTVAAEGGIGKGATFRFTLPRGEV